MECGIQYIQLHLFWHFIFIYFRDFWYIRQFTHIFYSNDFSWDALNFHYTTIFLFCLRFWCVFENVLLAISIFVYIVSFIFIVLRYCAHSNDLFKFGTGRCEFANVFVCVLEMLWIRVWAFWFRIFIGSVGDKNDVILNSGFYFCRIRKWENQTIRQE